MSAKKPSVFYILSLNSDGTEGRGWTVPQYITRSENYALWRNQLAEGSYGPENIYKLESGQARELFNGSDTKFYEAYKRTICGDAEKTEAWSEYLRLADALGGFAEPAENPSETVYIVGKKRARSVGGSRGSDVWLMASIAETVEEAEKLADDDDAIFEVQTEVYYGRNMLSEERMAYPPKAEVDAHKAEAAAAERDRVRLAALRERFIQSDV